MDDPRAALIRQQNNESLRVLLGATWEEIAAQHEMRCGACGSGLLTVQEVNLVREFWPPREAITITLTCGACGMTFDMPYQAREETTQP